MCWTCQTDANLKVSVWRLCFGAVITLTKPRLATLDPHNDRGRISTKLLLSQLNSSLDVKHKPVKCMRWTLVNADSMSWHGAITASARE